MSSELEMWLPVVGYEGFYEVSESGRVMALFPACNGQCKPGRLLKQNLQNTGYVTVTLCKPGTRSNAIPTPINVLVLEAFVGPRPQGHVSRHLDGTRTNNRVDNLAWGTYKQNEEDKRVHGRQIEGEKVWNAKLTAVIVRDARNRADAGEHFEDLAKEFHMSRSAMWAAISRKTWKHV